MAPAERSTEARELSLIGNLQLRVGLADTDAKLQNILHKYLAPLLLKLTSEHRSVRDKVIAFCQHINIRVQPPSIRLPVAALLKNFKENPHSILLRQINLRYIQQGIPRLSKQEQIELLPELIHGIAENSTSYPSHGSRIFNLLLKVMTQYELPSRASNEELELQDQLKVTEEDSNFLALRFGELILFSQSPSKTAPGLSAEQYRFLDLDGAPGTWNAGGGLNLTQTKLMVCRWLASNVFTYDQRFLPAVFASADTNSRIADIGEDILKRTLPHIDLEDEGLINKIYGYYFGGPVASAVRAPLRIKLLSILGKSVLSTTFTDKITDLVEDGLLNDQNEQKMVPGRETTKMRSAILSYLNFLARRGSSESTQAVAHKLVYAIRDFIETQGWPVANPKEDLALRSLGYEIIGLLSKAGPPDLLQEDNLELLRWLFRSLREDNSGNDTSISLEETLSTIMSVFHNVRDADVQDNLRDFLLEQMQDVDESDNAAARSGKPSFSRSTRYISVRFANRCLPYDDVIARWIDVLALDRGSQERHEVVEEAKKGLDPYWHLMNRSWAEPSNKSAGTNEPKALKFPDFWSTMSFFFGLSDPETLPDFNISLVTDGPANALIQRQSPVAYSAAVKFCRQMLVTEAIATSEGPQISVDADWERKLDLTVATSGSARQAISNTLRNIGKENPASKLAVLTLLTASSHGLQTFEGGSSGYAECHRQCGGILVEVCSLCSDDLLSQVPYAALALTDQIESNDPQTRALAAQAFGIVATHEGIISDKVSDRICDFNKVQQIYTTAVGAQANKVHGDLLVLGYFFSRLAFRGGTPHEEERLNDEFNKFLDVLFDIVRRLTDNMLWDAALIVLDQLALFSAITPTMISMRLDMNELIDKITKCAKPGNEKAIACLGHLAMIVDDDAEIGKEQLKLIEGSLRGLHEIKQAESQFAVGEALTCLACGWDSKALETKIDVDVPKPGAPTRCHYALPSLIDRTLADCRQTKPSLKKAAVIWLLCLIQYCGHRPETKERLPACQAAFKRCLSDRDTLVQESASRGLGLVYEYGDRNLKDDLVRDLVGSFSSDRAQISGTVTGDTQLFEPGALPTGDGNSITTYKDIMNLAAEVGDSSLVYRFMSLASNNAIWTTRAAFGRFGLSSVLSDSSVDGYLAENPKLYPKLYRYRFDPNPNVQRSMNDIWHALVKNPSVIIDKHFDAIMEDLLQSIDGREWRARQASCNAIANLVQGQPVEKYVKYLGRTWVLCLKVMDDMKNSVREAAEGLARTLTGILTRSLESSGSSERTITTLKEVLPFLLSTQGLESSAEDVRAFALHALLDIIKKAGAPTLRPFIPDLVEKILGLLSTVEPESVNYIHMNAQRYNLTEQRIDDMRLASVRQSPLMEAIERCLDLLDEATMKALVPKVDSAMKSAVGMPSKVGCSRILVSLGTRHNFVFQPHSDHFLGLVRNFIRDRNETVSLSYAASAGYVARGASDIAVTHFAGLSRKEFYFDSEDDRSRLIAGEMVRAVAKHASDRFKSQEVEFIPFIFFAKHDSDDQVKNVFQEVWNEHVGGSRTVSLYLGEIVRLTLEHLVSPKWVLKHTASRTIAAVVDAITSNIGQTMSASEAETLLKPLQIALGGKTWEGKEVVLQAFATFVEKGPEEFLSREEVKTEVKNTAVREAKRRNESYRPFAYEALGRVAAARKELDLGVVEIVGTTIDQLTDPDEDAMDVDAGQGAQKDKLRELTLKKAIVALARGTNLQRVGADEFLDYIGKLASLDPKSAAISSAIFTSTHDILERVHVEKITLEAVAIRRFADLLFEPLDGPENLRNKRAEAIVKLSMVVVKGDMKEKIRDTVAEEIGKEVSPSVKRDLELAKLNLERTEQA